MDGATVEKVKREGRGASPCPGDALARLRLSGGAGWSANDDQHSEGGGILPPIAQQLKGFTMHNFELLIGTYVYNYSRLGDAWVDRYCESLARELSADLDQVRGIIGATLENFKAYRRETTAGEAFERTTREGRAALLALRSK